MAQRHVATVAAPAILPLMWYLLVAALFVSIAPPVPEAPVERIAFGSCIREHRPVPAFDAINAFDPDVFIFLGDNVYGDTDDMDVLGAKYEKLGNIPGFQRLRDNARLLYLWDDHDYGRNDAGSEWAFKDQAKTVMLDFFREPVDSARRQREGNYDAVTLGPVGQRVQFILLDTRYFRSELLIDPEASPKNYLPNTNEGATILGEAQWDWLQETLTEPADIRIICTSIQLLATDHRFEKWSNFPVERERLLDLLKDIPDALVISGDRHSAEVSLFAYPDNRVLPEVTASALNQARGLGEPEPNRYRAGPFGAGTEFRRDYLRLAAADGESRAAQRRRERALRPRT